LSRPKPFFLRFRPLGWKERAQQCELIYSSGRNDFAHDEFSAIHYCFDWSGGDNDIVIKVGESHFICRKARNSAADRLHF
jgi:hypothetical protein